MYLIKIKATKAGGHWHVDMWMGLHEVALGKCGTLVFREEEWPLARMVLLPGHQEIPPRPIGARFLQNMVQVRDTKILLFEDFGEE